MMGGATAAGAGGGAPQQLAPGGAAAAAPGAELSPGLASAIAAAAAAAAGQPQSVNGGQLSSTSQNQQQQQQQGLALGGMMQGTMARGSMMGQKTAATMRGGDLQSRIASASRPADVLAVVSERGSGLYTEHLSQALAKVASLKMSGAEVTKQAEAQVNDLVTMARTRATGMGAKQLAEVLWALAQVRGGLGFCGVVRLWCRCEAKKGLWGRCGRDEGFVGW
jgi:hypothetical protein